MPVFFVTLPDDSASSLQSLGNLLISELRGRGYKVSVEPNDVGLPGTPTLFARRRQETNYFLVRRVGEFSDIEPWVGYARSCTRETRVTVCLPLDAELSGKTLSKLTSAGVGVLMHNEGGELSEIASGRDLAFHAVAPDRNTMKPRVRSLLGESLDRLERGDWRAAFEDACVVLEEECRKYLLKNQKLNRVRYKADGGKTRIPTADGIKRMTLGALKNVFCGMVSQNQTEAALCVVLGKLNPDRIKRVHKRGSGQAEEALRKRVGTHFWMINNALALLV